MCVGALLQNAAATGWEPMHVTAAGHAKISSLLTAIGATPHAMAGQAQGVTSAAVLPVNVVRHVDLQIGMLAKTPSQTAGGVGCKLLITPGISGVVVANNAQSWGSVLVDPLIQEQYQFLSAPLASAGLVSSVGTLTYKIETRDATGVIVALPNALLSQVCNAGAALSIRVVGFSM